MSSRARLAPFRVGEHLAVDDVGPLSTAATESTLPALTRPDDQGSFDPMRSCSTHDDWSVRCDVLTAIATAWPDDPDTLPILLGATDDGHEWVEARAPTAIAAGWPDHPETPPLLRRRAEDAEHTKADTRMAALMAYVAVGPEDTEALSPEVQQATVDRHRTSTIRSTQRSRSRRRSAPRRKLVDCQPAYRVWWVPAGTHATLRAAAARARGGGEDKGHRFALPGTDQSSLSQAARARAASPRGIWRD